MVHDGVLRLFTIIQLTLIIQDKTRGNGILLREGTTSLSSSAAAASGRKKKLMFFSRFFRFLRFYLPKFFGSS